MTDLNNQLRHLSSQGLASLGLSHIAYVRPIPVDDEGAEGYAVHAADGTRLAIMGDRQLAYAAILEQDMHPVSVH
ncbi:MAG: DUF1150 family protein [Alphaproteobacteria bacterium]|nr:DUF1150 family protein [Alphaproteobacteria bacterium]